MSKGKFRTARLKSDGTVEVRGPFTLEPGDPQQPALVSFYLVQEKTPGEFTTVGGDGRWVIGEKEWTGTCDGALLEAGQAWGYGMAIVVQEEPPGFATWTWTSPLPVTDDGGTPT